MFEKGQLKRLRDSSARLVKLVEEDSPPKDVVAKEMLLAFWAAMGYCGSQLFTKLGERILRFERQELGFCIFCEQESPRRATGKDGFCDECRTEFQGALSELNGQIKMV